MLIAHVLVTVALAVAPSCCPGDPCAEVAPGMPIVPSGEANPTVASTSQFCNGGAARSGVSGSRAHLPASYATSPLRYVSPKLVDDPPKYGTPRARALPPPPAAATYI